MTAKKLSTKFVNNILTLFENYEDFDLRDTHQYGYFAIEIFDNDESEGSDDNMFTIASLCFDVESSWEESTDYNRDCSYNHFILTANHHCYLLESNCTKQILHRLITNREFNVPIDFHRHFVQQITKGRLFCRVKAIRHSNSNIMINWYLSSEIVFTDVATFKIAMATSKNDLALALMAFTHGNRLFESKKQHEFSNNTEIENFYQTIVQRQKSGSHYYNEFETIVIDCKNLRTKLWRHQQMALKWMLMREISNENVNVDLDMQFEKIFNDKNGENLFFHSTLGHFFSEKVYREYFEHLKQSPTRGGILADEMGLGKTVDVIGLILNNPKPPENMNFLLTEQNLFQRSKNPLAGEIRCHCGIVDRNSDIQLINLEQLRDQCLRQQYHLVDNLIQCLMCGHYQHLECSGYSIEQSQQFGYVCSHCWPHIDLIESPATLIVCPTSILSQWINELSLHINKPNVKIFKYNGIKCKDYKFPPELACNDIVITTYEILKSELDFIAVHDYSHLRNSRRYYTPASPLCSIRWWRLVFDEAQLVEGRTTRTFRMAKSLHSVYRWAVTGTPIQRNIEDLFGLINFIGERPYNEEIVWKNHLYNPFCHGEQDTLIDVMSRCFWRTSKASVFDEIRISKPITIMEHCDLSQIERDFYLQEASNCQQSMMAKLIKIPSEMKILHLGTTVQSVIFNLALRLRQICCHPQMCLKVKLGDYCSIQDVLDKMIGDCKYDCEKCHREKIASINGMAACYLLQKDFKTAIHMYKEALTSINNVGDDIRTDKTQTYHIYYNLAQIIEFVGCTQIDVNGQPMEPFNGSQSILMPGDSQPCLPPVDTLSIEPDDRYLRLKAKQLYQDYLNTARLSLLTADRYRRELINKCDQIKQKFTLQGWWIVHALQELCKVMNVDEIIVSILELLADKPKLIDPIGPRSIESIRWQLCEYLNSFEKVRQQIRDAFTQLDQESLSGNPDRYIDCHIRPPEQSLPDRQERCHLCKTENVIKNFEKIIFKFNKSISINVDGEDEIEADNWNENLCLVSIRKVGVWFKSRTAGSAIDYDVTVADIDNFSQYIDECKKEYKAHRKCWRESSELVLRIDELNQAQSRYEHCIDSLALFHRDSSAKEMAEEKLCSNQQRLKYLNNLKSTLKDKDSIDSKVCSVCWSDLIRYSVLTCGHLLCIECMRNISKHSETLSRCPVCRSPFDHLKICFVDSNLLINKSSVMVEGNWSSKIVAIIRCVKRIHQESNDEKILIFSTWLRMLQLMEKALKMNHVESILISGSGDGKFAAKIDQFRKSDSCRVLLLPTRFACKGLNLTEASRVMFVNPILNKRDELQAIGRVNRIGQTRQTYVHKFIIKDSIEELIENYNKDRNYRSNCTNGEFTDLTVGEFCALFNVYKA